MFPGQDLKSLFDEKGNLIKAKVMEREDDLFPGMKLSKVFNAKGEVDMSLLEDFKKEVLPLIPGTKDMLTESGKVDKKKVFRQMKLLEAGNNGSFEFSSLMDAEGNIDQFRLHLLQEKVESINRDSDGQYQGLQDQSLTKLGETKTKYEQSKAQFDQTKAEYEKYFNDTKAVYKHQIDETKSKVEETKKDYVKLFNDTKIQLEENKKYYKQLLNKSKSDYKNLNLTAALGVPVDAASEEALRKGNLKKFIKDRPDIVGAALPEDDCFTKDGEEGQCMTEAKCNATGGTPTGKCHRGMCHLFCSLFSAI